MIKHKMRDMAVTKAALSIEVEEAVELKASDVDMSDLNEAALDDKVNSLTGTSAYTRHFFDELH